MIPLAREDLRRIDADALLFDNDGTLVDSTHAIEQSWRAFAARYGLDAEAVLRQGHGIRAEETMRLFLPDHALDEAAAWFDAHELQLVHQTVAIPGARELLDLLTALTAPWAVVTSARAVLARARFASAGLPLPPVLVSADDVSAGKPDPAGYLLAAERLGANPPSCVVIDDVAVGLQAGIAAGARVVVRGHYSGDETAGAHRVVDYTSTTVTVHANQPRIRGLW
jgi:mannitol-1-/sugar-/sorbitol-6-phosphatase